jgi:predicted GTPase
MPVQGFGFGGVYPATVTGIDILADQQTKEVLDKIGARATDPSLRIVVTGKTGVGKSSFIQALFLEEGEKFERPAHTTEVYTRPMPIYSPSGQPVNVELTDTPGMEALIGVGRRANRKEYVKQVSPVFKSADILLFCVRMDDDVRAEEVEMIRFMLHEFGPVIWTKVIFVLTFANRVTTDCLDEEKEREFTERFTTIQRALQVAMQQAGIAEEVAQATPVCVVGHPERKQLPNCDDWACPFLVECMKSGIAENIKINLLKSTWRRWIINTKRVPAGVGGATGIATGIGCVVAGSLISGTPAFGIGIPVAILGGTFILLGVAAASSHTVTSIKEDQESDRQTTKRIHDLQKPGSN